MSNQQIFDAEKFTDLVTSAVKEAVHEELDEHRKIRTLVDAIVSGERQFSEKSDVYFVRAGDLIKIGRSWSPRGRMSDMQSGSPVPLVMAGTIRRGGAQLERELHSAFHWWRKHGEWFQTNPLLEYLISKLPQEAPR